MSESQDMDDGSMKKGKSSGFTRFVIGGLFLIAMTVVGLILAKIIDLRPELDISGEPEDSTILARSEYKSSLTTVVEKDTTDEAKNVSIRLSEDSPTWLTLQNGYIQGTAPNVKTEYEVTIEANYEKGTKSNNVITHSFMLTVEDQKLEFQSLLNDAQVLFGAEFKFPEIKVLNQTGGEASNVTLTLTSPTTGEVKLNNGYIEGKAPEFEGNFNELVLTPLFVEVSATDGVSIITQSFNITVVFPDLQNIEWDTAESSSNVTITDGTVTKSESTDIAWAISKDPLPSDLKAAIIEFTINDIGTTTNYRQECGLDLISGTTIPKALDPANVGKNELVNSASIRNGIVFLSAVSSERIQRIHYRNVGTASGTSGTELEHETENTDTIQIQFMIYDSKVQDIVINGTSAFTYSTPYNLIDTSSNDWYLVVRDPENLEGFLDVSGQVALLV